MEVLYWLTGLCTVVVLPISLAVDGTDWGAQFRGMTRSDWAALLFCALVAHIGSVLGIQVGLRVQGRKPVEHWLMAPYSLVLAIPFTGMARRECSCYSLKSCDAARAAP